MNKKNLEILILVLSLVSATSTFIKLRKEKTL